MKNSCGKVFHFYFADQQKTNKKRKKIIKEYKRTAKKQIGKWENMEIYFKKKNKLRMKKSWIPHILVSWTCDFLVPTNRCKCRQFLLYVDHIAINRIESEELIKFNVFKVLSVFDFIQRSVLGLFYALTSVVIDLN